MSWDEFRQRFGEFLRGAAFGRYEQDLVSRPRLNDLFLLLCFMEAAALPNPATLYLLEVYPLPPRTFSPVAPPDGDRAFADRQPAMLLTAPDCERTGRLLRREGRRRQDDLLVGVRAGGEPPAAARPARVDRSRPLDRRTSSSGRSARERESRRGSSASRSTPSGGGALHRRRQARHRADVQPEGHPAGPPADRHGGGVARAGRGRAARSHDRPHRRAGGANST